jgi:hypothetical protein
MYLKPAIVAASVLFAASAFAQGASKYAPGQQPNTAKGPGHSESAPGHQKDGPGPGHSESAPGQKMNNQKTGMPTSNTPRK